jgi:hypothetical protein
MQLHRVQGPQEVSRYSNSQQAERSGNQIPVLARFSVHVQIGPVADQASHTMGTVAFPGAKGPGRVVVHTPI